MAARNELSGMQVVDLHQVQPLALSDLLDEEVLAWTQRLRWDFHASAELVRRYVGMQALDGYALLEDGRAVGYTYYVAEEHKGLIGDLYLSDRHRTPENHQLLLGKVIEALRQDPYTVRVEAQFMMLDCDWVRGLDPSLPQPLTFERLFLRADPNRTAELPPGRAGATLVYESWKPHWMDEAAELIAKVYERHVDSRINDQYHSAAGARRFLQNIVQYPGCGQFFQSASWVARDPRDGKLAGLCLASIVSHRVGHLTQVCVRPDHQRTGAGYEMLRMSMQALKESGCGEVTLTVTASNRQAVALYESMGFRVLRRFEALVWERLSA